MPLSTMLKMSPIRVIVASTCLCAACFSFRKQALARRQRQHVARRGKFATTQCMTLRLWALVDWEKYFVLFTKVRNRKLICSRVCSIRLITVPTWLFP